MSGRKAMVCPACGEGDGLATVEELVGTAHVTFYGDDLVWDGWTDVDWNSSTTVGLCCDCGWSYPGIDWREALRSGGDGQE
jgi:hypothetical protein